MEALASRNPLTPLLVYFDVEISLPRMAALHSVLNDLPFCLARTTLSFRRVSDQTLRAVGLESLAPGLASVLHGLDEIGGCTVNALLEKTHLPNGTLTGLLDTLENDGYIRRTRNPRDGRSWLIELTERGDHVCEKLRVRHHQVMAMFREVISDAEAIEVSRLLEKLTVRMRAYKVEMNGEAKRLRSGPRTRRVRA